MYSPHHESAASKSDLSQNKTITNTTHIRFIQYDVIDASPRHVSFILEMCHGGDLLSRVQEYGRYNENDAMLVMGYIFSALKYMHQLNICHRDIKLENVLLVTRTSNTNVKLADFGTARVMSNQHLASTFSGTRYTMAPEARTVRASKQINKSYFNAQSFARFDTGTFV